jgi:hypothetical protein
VGYPRAIKYYHNNFPIIRKGITATHPIIRFNYSNEFLIDAPCYPGVSGSPVIFKNLQVLSEEDI